MKLKYWLFSVRNGWELFMDSIFRPTGFMKLIREMLIFLKADEEEK